MKRNMTAAVMALAMSTVMSAAVLSGCGSTPKETVPETAKEQQTDAQTADTTGESGKDEESSAEAASGNYGDKTIGFVGMTLNNEYHITLANGAKVEAEAKGVKIEVQAGDQHASADAQLGIIENMIANRWTESCWFPVLPTVWNPPLQNVRKQAFLSSIWIQS